MGATYKEVDVLSRPPVSGQDFMERIAPICAEAEAEGRETIVVFLPSLKKELEAKSVNFEAIISGPCHK